MPNNKKLISSNKLVQSEPYTTQLATETPADDTKPISEISNDIKSKDDFKISKQMALEIITILHSETFYKKYTESEGKPQQRKVFWKEIWVG